MTSDQTLLPIPARRPLAVWLAGRIAWDAHAALADRLAWEVSEPGGRPPTLVVGELESSITIGRTGSRADVDMSAEELRSRRLEIRFVGRGGGAILHGPGQVFVSLFARLEDLGLERHDVGGLVSRFQAGLRGTLAHLGCAAVGRTGTHGLFGRTGLLAAVGIAVRRGVSCHGGFLNVCPALDVAQRVRSLALPAGTASSRMESVSMGSVEAELRRKVRLQDARTALVEHLADAFAVPRMQIQAGFPHAAPFFTPSETHSRVG